MASVPGSSPVRRYSSAPASGGRAREPASVRNRPISNSGFGAGSIRRNSFSTQPVVDERDAVALIAAAASATGASAARVLSARTSGLMTSPCVLPRRVVVSSSPAIIPSRRSHTSSSWMPSTMTPLRAPVIRASTAPGACFSTALGGLAGQERERERGRSRASRRRTRRVTTVRNDGSVPSRSVAQSVNRAWRISRDFAANQRCRCRNGTSAWRSRTTRVPASSTFLPVDADEQRRQRVDDRRVRIRRRSARAAPICIGSRCSDEPVRRVGAERQEVRAIADARKLGQPAHLDRDQAGERLQIELGRLHVARQVGDDEDRFAARRGAGRRAPCGSGSRRTRASRGRTRDAACASRSAASSS